MLHGRTILIVEDHDDARELIATVLQGAGAQVVSASNTRDAIERVTGTPPDVLVADLGLPGEDGYVLLTRIRAMYPQTPAIALTAYARAADRDRALAAGFQQHVIKPIDPRSLLHLIMTLL
jgi:CheY-like chemotaxis protein